MKTDQQKAETMQKTFEQLFLQPPEYLYGNGTLRVRAANAISNCSQFSGIKLSDYKASDLLLLRNTKGCGKISVTEIEEVISDLIHENTVLPPIEQLVEIRQSLFDHCMVITQISERMKIE